MLRQKRQLRAAAETWQQRASRARPYWRSAALQAERGHRAPPPALDVGTESTAQFAAEEKSHGGSDAAQIRQRHDCVADAN